MLVYYAFGGGLFEGWKLNTELTIDFLPQQLSLLGVGFFLDGLIRKLRTFLRPLRCWLRDLLKK